MNCVGEVIKSETLQVLKKLGTLVLFSFNRKLSRRFTKWIKVKWCVALDPRLAAALSIVLQVIKSRHCKKEERHLRT